MIDLPPLKPKKFKNVIFQAIEAGMKHPGEEFMAGMFFVVFAYRGKTGEGVSAGLRFAALGKILKNKRMDKYKRNVTPDSFEVAEIVFEAAATVPISKRTGEFKSNAFFKELKRLSDG